MRIVAHFLNLFIVIELLLWNRKERQNAIGYVLKGPSRKIGTLLTNMISNVKLKLAINNVKAD